MRTPRRAGMTVLTHEGIIYRLLEREAGEHAALVELQAAIWGRSMATPHHQLIAADHVGGVLLGAFDAGRCVGFSYGFPAHRHGRSWLHSHQTGVRGSYRDRGIGRILKWFQRWRALEVGYDLVTWTFDPLQARNAHVNLELLGVTASGYEPDYYGELTGHLNEGLASDRLLVDWDLRAERVAARFARFRAATVPDWPGSERDRELPLHERGVVPDDDRQEGAAQVVRSVAVEGGPSVPADEPETELDAPTVRIATPPDVDELRRRYGDAPARRWRRAHRAAFGRYFERGYVIVGFDRAASSYVLARTTEDRSTRVATGGLFAAGRGR